MKTSQNIITKNTISRLVKDIKQIIKFPLIENGIYYSHDETDMLKGYALIVGQSDTPYYGGFYFFEFTYPTDYPHSPPVVTYHTNGHNVRFNPNLYKCGKVCISILNTWRGEQWSSCQNISTVLLTLCIILNKDPLLNEPGVSRLHRDLQNYNHIIEFSNINIAVCDIVNKSSYIYKDQFSTFYPYIKEIFLKNYTEYIDICKRNNEIITKNTIIKTDFYDMKITINYEILMNKLERTRETLLI